MMNNLLTNWKTTSIGLLTICGSIVHLVFANRGGVDSEGVWMTCITGVVTGLGFLFAGDSSKSVEAHQETLTEIENLKSAVRTGDTSILTRQPEEPVKQ